MTTNRWQNIVGLSIVTGMCVTLGLLLTWVHTTAAGATHSPPVLTHTIAARPASAEGMVLIPGTAVVFRDGERQQQVQVQSFYLDLYEVTLGEFKAFLAATG